MLRKSLWIAALGLGLSVLPASTASAQQYLDQGTWELTLSGSGASNQDVNAGSFGVTGSIGYFIIDQLEVLARQSVNYADADNVGAGTSWNATTAVALDYHFDLDRWQPFVGAAIGYTYGKNSNDTGFGGPEAGVKYFVKDDTFIYGLVQYQFFFNNGNGFEDNFEDGSFVYAVGIGFTW
jgi:hypothetical protein